MSSTGPAIDLWIVDLDRWADTLLSPSTLTDADRSQADRLHDPLAGRRLLARRSLTRWLLASSLGIDPSGVALVRTCPTCGSTEHGRPSVVGEPFQFSVSSSGGVAAVGLSERPLGVDIELVDTDIVPLPKALTDGEQRRLAALSPDDQRIGFLRLWTAKEAVLKAEGHSLADDPATIDVEGVLTGPAADAVAPGPTPGTWRVQVVEVEATGSDRVVVAVADENGWRVVTRSVDA